ncbi:hypothetical protein ADUPG1_013032 [Aduncisulcus paluster]|uniref:Band 7 domain-containing protein n=1 Tax=Aduncisulcus paluster TaxID=2918883 RepID=A0ABQ5K237_9EUKA|nr:hypothetical protein ADUPG1_013032 [Aduncisulcus paluster]|eukprot:gnl/Carplike_NY0171/2150_a2891_915.p1 GENE.gnl/Carplike_NY0171/2150_a2891_915~~gnl/Carplike_NY0171/2150_a2891_915.p1  ORF type:complete len:301 (+),score=78.40 gnl/Carplike_NY0171/2150_a2891_915:17-919(+)
MNELVIAILVWAGVAVLVGGICAACSLTFVPFGYVGVCYNVFTLDIDEKTYTNGPAYIGFYQALYKFPMTQQTLDISGSKNIAGRTKDGLELEMDCTVQYSLQSENVNKLFPIALMDYESLLLLRVRDIIRDVAAQYDASKFFDDISSIGGKMKEELAAGLSDSLYINIDAFNIIQQDLPDAFEEAKDEGQQLAQQLDNYTQKIALAQAEQATSTGSATAQASVIANDANTSTIYVLQDSINKANYNRVVNKQYAASIADYSAELGGVDNTLSYLEYLALSDNEDSQIVIGSDSVTAFVQ